MLIYTQEEVVTELDYLQSLFDKLCDLLEAFPRIIATGGQAIPALLAITGQTEHPLQPISVYLVVEIAQDTTRRLSHKVSLLVCPDCLVYCTAHPVQIKTLNTAYTYGCRNCRQSREFLEVTGPVIAVLDRQMLQKSEPQGESLRANWLAHRTLFDFDAIEIINATDEQVERFAVQIGNDTDPLRQPKYKQMSCHISPKCRLSENTIRILRRTFGQIAT